MRELANQVILNGIRALEPPMTFIYGSACETQPALTWCRRYRVDADRTAESARVALAWIQEGMYPEHLFPLYSAAGNILRAALELLDCDDDDSLCSAMNRVMEAQAVVIRWAALSAIASQK